MVDFWRFVFRGSPRRRVVEWDGTERTNVDEGCSRRKKSLINAGKLKPGVSARSILLAFGENSGLTRNYWYATLSFSCGLLQANRSSTLVL